MKIRTLFILSLKVCFILLSSVSYGNTYISQYVDFEKSVHFSLFANQVINLNFPRDNPIFLIRGNIKLNFEGNIMTADKLVFNRWKLIAIKNVRIKEPSGALSSAEHLILPKVILSYLKTAMKINSQTKKYQDKSDMIVADFLTRNNTNRRKLRKVNVYIKNYHVNKSLQSYIYINDFFKGCNLNCRTYFRDEIPYFLDLLDLLENKKFVFKPKA